MVLLPTSTSKLMTQWQGPYQVIKAVGRMNYLADMRDRKYGTKFLHKYAKEVAVPISTGYPAQDSPEEFGCLGTKGCQQSENS